MQEAARPWAARKNRQIHSRTKICHRVLGRLIIKHMTRLRWSDDQLLRKIRELDSGTRDSLASIARYKAGTGGQPSTQQIGLYAEALRWDESECHALLYPGEPLAAGQPMVPLMRSTA